MKKNKAKIVCPICQQSNYRGFWAMRGYVLYRCLSCEMVWDPYVAEDLGKQYDKNYFINENPKGGYANYFEGMTVNKKTFCERLKRIKNKTGKTGRLLDVGCALGDCLVEAEGIGWDNVEGLEISDYAYSFAKTRGLKIKKGDLNTVRYPANSFDILMMQDVIEHITDPIKQLKQIYRILKPGGWVFIITPNIEGKWSRILGSWWYHYKPGEHVTYFSQRTIKKSLIIAGFTNIQTGSTFHVMSLGYILNRLRFYFPNLFGLFLFLTKKTFLHNLVFKVYSGELEVWGQKPLK